jgi:hypothetical protein
MPLFALLLSQALCYFCRHTITIESTTPLDVSLPVGDGDLICLNSTLPYLSVLFQHTNLLSIRYFLEDEETNTLVQSGTLRFPSDAAGVYFGNTNGHIEIQTFLPGFLSFAAFAFPVDCGHNRYISTVLEDNFLLGSRFQLKGFTDAIHPSACFWCPHPTSGIYGEVNPMVRSMINLCNSGEECTKAFRNDITGPEIKHVHVNSTQFLMFDAAEADFAATYMLGTRVNHESRYMDAKMLLPNEVSAGIIEGERINQPAPPEPQPVKIEKIEKAEKVESPVEKVPKESATVWTTFEVVSIVCVIGLSAVVAFQCVVGQRAKAKLGDGSEERLLDQYPRGLDGIPAQAPDAPYPYAPSFYSQPIAPYGMPYPFQAGGFFPVAQPGRQPPR